MKKFLLTLSLACSLTASLFAADKIGDKAPVLTDFDVVNIPVQFKDSEFGKNGKIEFKKGTVYVVEFWATWCPPCVASVPHLSKLQEKYGDKVVVIGVSVDQPSAAGQVKKFATDAKRKMNYRVIHDVKKEISAQYMEPFKAKGIPTAFIVDADGKIAWTGHPMKMDNELDKVVKAAK